MVCTTTRSGSASQPNMCATSLRVSYAPWSVLHTFTPFLYGNATAHSGSRNACSVNGVSKSCVTTCADVASAAFASPRVMWRLWHTLS